MWDILVNSPFNCMRTNLLTSATNKRMRNPVKSGNLTRLPRDVLSAVGIIHITDVRPQENGVLCQKCD